ncbi:MAG: AAA family ATPase [Clostridia bacterium]|nr:AAA family ATPase [Clostridia bacterium]
MSAKRILMTAGRGGVGTGFCTVNLGLALSRLGQRVLLVDGGVVCRSLDAILSCSEEVVYDLSDLCAGRVGAKEACLTPAQGEGLMLIPGVFSPTDAPKADALHRALDPLADDFDFILVDAPALPEVIAGARRYDLCCIVSDPSAAALRGAERVGVTLCEAGAGATRLLLNRFSLLHPAETGQANARTLVDAAHTQLLGIIPPVGEDEFLPPPHMEDYPLLGTKGPHKRDRAKTAFLNIAKRLAGEDVPLLAGMRGLRFRRRALLY